MRICNNDCRSLLPGRSHDKSYSLFRVGDTASDGLKLFCETGQSDGLEAQSQGDGGVFDEFNGRAISSGQGTSRTEFFVDGNHTQVSTTARLQVSGCSPVRSHVVRQFVRPCSSRSPSVVHVGLEVDKVDWPCSSRSPIVVHVGLEVDKVDWPCSSLSPNVVHVGLKVDKVDWPCSSRSPSVVHVELEVDKVDWVNLSQRTLFFY
jgi:hypothetical protein